MASVRKETDSLGVVEVPSDKLWGAQTQRSLEHFSIGTDLIPREMITAYATLKKAAAIANHEGKRLDDERYKLIVQTCDEILAGQHRDMSSLLIPHRLREEVGTRIGAAMSTLNPSLSEQIAELLAIAKKHNARIVEDFFPDVPDGPLKQTALAIISAWYLGVVTDAPDAEVFAYAHALMYGPTSDVMTIPSYAISGPNAWNADTPPLDSMPKF